MRSPQIIIYEADRAIGDLLRGTAEVWGWPLRELRDEAAIVRALREGGPSIVVIEMGVNLEHDLTLLERLTWLCPDTATIAVSSVASAELTGLAWDLGAAYVLSPPQPRDALLPVVLGLMETVRGA